MRYYHSQMGQQGQIPGELIQEDGGQGGLTQIPKGGSRRTRGNFGFFNLFFKYFKAF